MDFVKKLPFVFLGAVLLTATFFLDSKLDVSLAKPDMSQVEATERGKDAVFRKEKSDMYRIDSGKITRMTLLIRNNIVLRLAPESTGTLEISDPIRLTIERGRFWVNSTNSIQDISINTRPSLSDDAKASNRASGEEAKQLMSRSSEASIGTTSSVQIRAEPGIFDLHYGDSTLILVALRHSLILNILGNQLIIPESRQMTVSQSKLAANAETIKKLRYSKLAKELPYVAADKPDEWTAKNQKDDAAFLEKYTKQMNDKIRSRGAKIPSDQTSVLYTLHAWFKGAHNVLTFDSAKKTQQEINNVFDYFDTGTYAILIGDLQRAERLFDSFKIAAKKISGSDEAQKAFLDRLDRFAFAQPSEALFPARVALREAVHQSAGVALHAALNDMLDLAASGNDVETKAKIISTAQKFGALANEQIQSVNGESALADVFFESIRLNDFLREHPSLLREEFLKIAELFERQHLALIGSKDEAEDERQFLISEKLKTITALKSLMEKGDMPFQDARSAILLVSNQIEGLKPTFSDAAVSSYFEDQLHELSPLIAFLHSTSASNLRGSFKENFQDFQSRTDEMKKVTDLLAGATGGSQISPFRREELAGIVATDLGGIGMTAVKIILPEVEDDVRVRVVSATFENKILTGLYDTGRKVMSEIVFDGEKIPNAIRLENVKNFFLIRLGKLVLPTGVTEESLTEAPSKESLFEKVAKEALLGELANLGIVVEEKYLGLENLNDGVIHVRLATLGQGVDAKVFSFDVSQKGSVVSGLKVQTVAGEIPVNDSFALRELPVKVEQIYQRALFEKQKEDELKKLMNGNGSSTASGTSSAKK